MNSRHHPDEATLASYAACSIERNYAIVLDMHISQCEHCQQRIALAERIGSALFGQLTEVAPAPTLKAELIALLDASTASATAAKSEAKLETELEVTRATSPDTPALADDATSDPVPAIIRDWPHDNIDSLPWTIMAPGIRRIRLNVDDGDGEGRLNLLRISPGTSIPSHSHDGNELTLVLSGSYRDELGRFGPGCVSDLDDRTEHRPLVNDGEDCVCLVATDAPLNYHGWLPRLMQHLVRL